MARPIIAVVGSLDTARQYDPPLRDPQVARNACEQLGRELALKGCDLLAYSSGTGFVEADILKGYVESGKAQPRSIQVRSRLGKASSQFQEALEHREFFDIHGDASSDWEVSYYQSLIEIQGIILVGGGRSTLVTGLIALAFHIPVVPVATFGGSAQKVWASLDRVRNEALAEEVSAMAQPWHEGSAARLVAGLVAQGARKAAKAEESGQEERRQSRRAVLSLSVAALLLVTRSRCHTSDVRVETRHRRKPVDTLRRAATFRNLWGYN